MGGRRVPTEPNGKKRPKGPITGNIRGEMTIPPHTTQALRKCPFAGSTLPEGASPYGALGHGRERLGWVADWYAPYSTDYQTNPTGPEDGEEKILRGGSTDTDEILFEHLSIQN
jgi:hypothetical protein